MSCCGNKRAALSPAPSPAREPSRRQVAKAAPPIPDQKEKMWPDIHFEHQGAGLQTCVGKATGRVYHWSGHGAIQAVDYRDAGGLVGHNLLRRVK